MQLPESGAVALQYEADASRSHEWSRMTIATVIVDGDALARRRLLSLFAEEDDFEVVAECADGIAAVERVRALAPSLVVLDVELPKLDGFGVVEAIGAEQMPAIVFVTAYDQYALKAFECHAIDYLLKPYDRDRFRRTLGQVRRRVEVESGLALVGRLTALLQDLTGRGDHVDRLAVRSAGKVILLRAEEIEWIDAAGNYVHLNAGGRRYRMREKISALEQRLDPGKFLRIHRSTIVATDAIREIRPAQHGECLVVLSNGKRLTLSRSYRDRLNLLTEGPKSQVFRSKASQP